MGSKKKKRHGKQCAQIDAPEDAVRAEPIPPSDSPKKDGSYRDGDDETGHHDSSGAQGGYGSKIAGSHAASAQDYPQEEVRICGFIEHAAFNGLRAHIES